MPSRATISGYAPTRPMWLVLRKDTAPTPCRRALSMANLVANVAPTCPMAAAGVNHRQARLVANHLGLCLRLEAPLGYGLGVFVKPDGAVRVVAEQIGLDQMVHNRTSVIGPATEGGEKRVTDCPQIGRIEAWHVLPFLPST